MVFIYLWDGGGDKEKTFEVTSINVSVCIDIVLREERILKWSESL
jgi:hypothetical protein